MEFKFYVVFCRRVRARQRAAVMVKRQESGAEKASSKDSAYGYSGGETSRMHTREPTPGMVTGWRPPNIEWRFNPSLLPDHQSFSPLNSFF